MMSCKKTSRLLSQQRDRTLSAYETVSVKLHLMMCGACSNLRNNLDLLHKACGHLGDQSKLK